MAANRGCAITGWASALPDRVVTNDELTVLWETSDEWIRERCGIHERRHATGPFVAGPATTAVGPGGLGTTGSLAVAAGRAALDRAGVEASDVGLLVLCTTTPDQTVPATSSSVSAALGVGGGAMDLNAACAGFTYGLVSAAGLVATGIDRVLVVGAETLTRATNWADRTSAFLFGDGAGAVLVEAVPGDGSLLGWDLG
ncbi:MAG: 3-oxoacyl-ACP synthase III family protein, partial [Acidimicrobiales bacterium]